MTKHYYHLFANGDDAKNFITEEVEFKAAFNRIAVCAYICKIDVLAASIEDSHPHFLLKGDPDSVQLFATKYVDLSNRYLARHRGSTEGVVLSIEICEINDEQYLMNAASYVIIQATKDGKAILPYDYMYGTGALYFRPAGTILPLSISLVSGMMLASTTPAYTNRPLLQILCNDTSPSNGAIIRILRSLMDIKPHLEHNGHLSQQITTFKLGGFRNQRIRIICSIKNISSLQGYITFICPVKN